MTTKPDNLRGYIRAEQPLTSDGEPDWTVVPGPEGPEPAPRPKRGRPGNNVGLRLARAKMVEQAIRMHLSGMSYRQIAEQIGYHDVKSLYRAIWNYIDRYVPKEDVARMRLLESERYDQMTALLWSKVNQESPVVLLHATIDRVMRISAERRRLWGMDLQPPDVVSGGGTTDGDGLDQQREAAERGFALLPIDERQDLWRRLTAIHAEAEVVDSRPAGVPEGGGEE